MGAKEQADHAADLATKNVPDDEGWITVSHKGKKLPSIKIPKKVNILEPPKTKATKKKRLLFEINPILSEKAQARARKELLQQKFQESREKIAKLRAQRRFKT